MSEESEYRGRFAPSPTGPLHFGSLVAAVGSFLQAHQQQGRWLVRMEDLDPPREVPGAADEILRTLEHYGLNWDGEVIYQSQRSELYLDALERLTRQGLVYPCGCSRKEVMDKSLVGRFGPIYQGICRQGLSKNKQPRALRVLTHDSPIVFTDQLQGSYEQCLEAEIGDFVVRRADKLFAYQLAVVIDDAEQGITEIVRGADLLDNTPRQIHLQQLLEIDTGAQSIHDLRPQHILFQVLLFLNQQPPAEIIECDLVSFWQWALANWQLNNIPKENQPAPKLQS